MGGVDRMKAVANTFQLVKSTARPHRLNPNEPNPSLAGDLDLQFLEQVGNAICIPVV